jgi:hypothetical protein
MSRRSHTRRIASTLAASLAAVSLAAPIASARPYVDGPPSDAQVPAVPQTVIQRVHDTSFDVGDAAIGAGAGIGLIVLTLGAIGARSHTRLRFVSH